MSKVIAFIPARCGSKSIPMKNIGRLCGKPLIYWNLEALERCAQVDEIVVATDCSEIETIVQRFNFQKVSVFRRSEANAQDSSSTESVMLEFIEQVHPAANDLFMLVQATSPLTTTEDFQGGLDKFRKSDADSLLTCVRWKRFFWSPDGQSLNYDYRQRPRRQDFQGMLMENGAFYISRVKDIIKYKNRLNGRIVIYEMPEYTGLELDEPHDWHVMEQLMHRYRIQEKARDFSKIKLFATDVDGVLTDAGMYYSEKGDELKKFNTHDGKALELMRKKGIKTAIITSEQTEMVARRGAKLKVDYVFQGLQHGGKLDAILEMCKKENIQLSEVAYIGDDINCREALENVGFAACPANALPDIKAVPNIIHLEKSGGEGAIREFYERFMKEL